MPLELNEARAFDGAAKTEWSHMEAQALRVREHCIRMAGRGGCFIGASLSCVDLLVFMYNRFLKISAETLNSPNRDYLLLSKGHDVPALYGLFAEMGWMPKERLNQHLNPKDSVYWHPNRAVPGVEFHSGSLGHLLSVGLGMALDVDRVQGPNRVVVVTGDGELNEGTNWESLLVAASLKVRSLWVVVDRNHFQANVATEDLVPLEPLVDKFKAFRAVAVERVNGHDFSELQKAFQRLEKIKEPGVRVIVADTVRGRGLPSIEARADRWFCNFNDEQVTTLLSELHGHGHLKLEGEGLTVR